MFSKDERFKCIDKMRERETLFQERVSELKKVNRQREEDQRQAARSRGEKVCVPLKIIIVHVKIKCKPQKYMYSCTYQ